MSSTSRPAEGAKTDGLTTFPVSDASGFEPEELALDEEQQRVYDAAWTGLMEPSTNFLAPIPSVVSVDHNETIRNHATLDATKTNQETSDAAPALSSGLVPSIARASTDGPILSFDVTGLMERQNNDDHQPFITIISPSRGHHELNYALERLEGLEKEEQSLLEHASLTRILTEIITGEEYADARKALQRLKILGQAVMPRRVCQHPFRKNDIVWVCRTCQADETCVLCHACYSKSNHEGHDVAFYHAQAGGCCDCGDPDGTYTA